MRILWVFFFRRIHTAAEVLFLLLKAFDVDFYFALGVDYLADTPRLAKCFSCSDSLFNPNLPSEVVCRIHRNVKFISNF